MPVILNHAPPNQYGISPRPYHEKTVRWYHSHIIEWMMANPAGKLEDCAKHVGKTPATLSAIIRSDMFQAALALRKKQLADRNDLVLSGKITEVAVKSLDTLLGVLEKKKDSLSPETLNEIACGALDRLGYSPKKEAAPAPAVHVNVNQQTIATPVSEQELNEARLALRQNQQRLAGSPPPEQQGITTGGSASPILEGELLGPPQLEGAAPVPSKEG